LNQEKKQEETSNRKYEYKIFKKIAEIKGYLIDRDLKNAFAYDLDPYATLAENFGDVPYIGGTFTYKVTVDLPKIFKEGRFQNTKLFKFFFDKYVTCNVAKVPVVSVIFPVKGGGEWVLTTLCAGKCRKGIPIVLIPSDIGSPDLLIMPLDTYFANIE
jgi:hypothetical protein